MKCSGISGKCKAMTSMKYLCHALELCLEEEKILRILLNFKRDIPFKV